MKRIIWIFLLVAVWAGTGNAQKTTKPVPVFVIHQPTIIAFYPHYTQDELDKGEGDAAAMDDFSFYAYKAEKRLHKAGIDFLTKEARSFKVRVGTKVRIDTNVRIIGVSFTAQSAAWPESFADAGHAQREFLLASIGNRRRASLARACEDRN